MSKSMMGLLGSLALGIASGCAAEQSVRVEAPAEQVWDYLGDSDLATEWSVYFHHISPLPGAPDGEVGSRRRCFRRADETGIYWDEIILAAEAPHFRRVLAYNFHGFDDPAANDVEIYVYHQFTALDADTTEVSFSIRPAHPSRPSPKYVGAARETGRVFGLNLENIKAAVEASHAGREYERLHPYEP